MLLSKRSLQGLLHYLTGEGSVLLHRKYKFQDLVCSSTVCEELVLQEERAESEGNWTIKSSLIYLQTILSLFISLIFFYNSFCPSHPQPCSTSLLYILIPMYIETLMKMPIGLPTPIPHIFETCLADRVHPLIFRMSPITQVWSPGYWRPGNRIIPSSLVLMYASDAG